LGYVLPHGALGAAFGSNARVEVGGSYVHATSSLSTGGTFTTQTMTSPALLNGTGALSQINCSGGFVCVTNSQLATDFAAWQFNGKLVSDFKAGVWTLSPSFTAFVGQDKVAQTFSQTFLQVGGLPATYFVSSSLHWTDWGAQLGIDAKVDIAPRLTLD